MESEEQNKLPNPVLVEKDYLSITERTLIIYIQNTKLAAALIAMGIELRKDPPYTHRIERGKRIVVWNFNSCSPDRKWETQKLAKAWKRDIQFFLDPRNEDHPFAKIMQYQHNLEIMTAHILNDKDKLPYKDKMIDKNEKPFAVFALPAGVTYYAKPGSNKYKYLTEVEGLKPL